MNEDIRNNLRGIETWIFDLDNTLYPAECNLFAQIDQKMNQFVATLLDLPRDQAHAVQKDYFHRYGTTLNGLMRHHDIEPKDFLDFVHDIDISVLPALSKLDTALARLPGRKVIFTNGTVDHAERVTRALGIDRHFEGWFDIVASDYVPKPAPAPYDQMLKAFAIQPSRAAMVEDMARNLMPAAERGMTTVWVPHDSAWSKDAADHSHIHHIVDDLSDWLYQLTAAD